MPSTAVENYLKAILILSDTRPRVVPLGRIGERVGVTPGTVTSMMRQMAQEGWVEYEPRRGVKLTSKGWKEALSVLRRHRLVELFLVQIMHLDWAHVHEEAEILEHAISDRLLERMDEMLGRPIRDPHGDPIPTLDGEWPTQPLIPLAECHPGTYEVVRVLSDEPSFLEWLEDQSLRPGCRICVREVDEFAQTLSIATVNAEAGHAIGTGTASRIMVTRASE